MNKYFYLLFSLQVVTAKLFESYFIKFCTQVWNKIYFKKLSFLCRRQITRYSRLRCTRFHVSDFISLHFMKLELTYLHSVLRCNLRCQLRCTRFHISNFYIVTCYETRAYVSTFCFI